MIGPPGLPKVGRRVFNLARRQLTRTRDRLLGVKWGLALYLAGVLAHFSHHMALGLPAGMSFDEALFDAPISLVWPADLIGTLMTLS